MVQQSKRIPAERNPRPDRDVPGHVALEGRMANGHGTGDFGFSRGLDALSA